MNPIKEMAVKPRNHSHVVTITQYSRTTKLVAGSILGAIAAILQSAGIFTGIGYIFSMLTTMPIVVATVFSLRVGFMTYGLTILLLVLFQPSELIVFPFTTGLLGISLGIGLRFLKRGILVVSFAGICLALGIMIILYGFRFPVLGPTISSKVNLKVILGTVTFSLIYTWIWMQVCISFIKVLNKVIFKKSRLGNSQ